MEKNHIFENFENRQKHTLKSLYAFFLSELGKQQPAELDQTILQAVNLSRLFHTSSFIVKF